MLTSALAAGREYLWCSMMDEAVEACCCAPEPSRFDRLDAATDHGAELRSACCQQRGHDGVATGRLPTVTVDVPPALPAIGSTAPTPALMARPLSGQPNSSARVSAKMIRAGPPTAIETCVRLQVFRC